MSHLLDRASEGIDSRHGLDLDNWSMLLEALALNYRRLNSRFTSRVDLELLFVEEFRNRSWGGSPLSIIQRLIHWNILVEDGDRVGLWHPALCDLFLGRRLQSEFSNSTAENEDSYAAMALNRPLSHARPLRHFSELTRGNSKLLSRMETLLDEVDREITPMLESASTRAVENWEGSEPGAVIPANETSDEESNSDDDIFPQDDHEADRDAEWTKYELDHRNQAVAELFEEDREWSIMERSFKSVELASYILRSSERLENNEEKARILESLLVKWAELYVLMKTDPVVTETIGGTMRTLLQSRTRGHEVSDEVINHQAERATLLLLGLIVTLMLRCISI